MSKTYKRLVLAEELDIMPIAMSYDHRVINGADAGRFMVFLKDILDNFND
jgi:Pyruvate/2-oxoglutarate dehydrogenase complex, dihydrolipoamide acyltransferase (E2) component, and related enzymes